MLRALLTLAAGILLAVLLAAAIAGDGDLLTILGPVLVTTAIGAAVFTVVAWRARIRERARELEHHQVHHTNTHDDGPTRPTTAPVTPEEETDRG